MRLLNLDEMTRRRHQMVRGQIEARGVCDPRVLGAMRDVPRHEFVPDSQRDRAYDDRPLAIGDGQTISQPYMVAVMSEALHVGPDDRVLEVGTGSGYQTALLAMLAGRVISIERLPTLAARARDVLQRLGITNAIVLVGDGSQGVPAHQPYDGILVAAGAPSAPEPLISQLADGGRLVAPIGSATHQQLITILRQGSRLIETSGEGCVFVPLVGAHGWKNAADVT